MSSTATPTGQQPEATTTAEPSKALTPAAAPPARIPVQFDANDPVSLYMDTGIFEQLQRVAKLMSASELVPAHLRGKQSDCFLVAAQAFRWRMDPFSVAQHTFVTSGKLGYEGKLIAALINASGRTQENLLPVYSGPVGKPDRTVKIVARLKGESKDREIEGTVAGWQTQNEKWKSMPDQMLFYRGAREWARRHMPEVMLGISAEEEVGEAVTLTAGADGTFRARPSLDQVTERLEAVAPAPPARVPGEDDADAKPNAAGPAAAASTGPVQRRLDG